MPWKVLVENARDARRRGMRNAETFIKEICVQDFILCECPPPYSALDILLYRRLDLRYDQNNVYMIGDYFDQGNLWNRIEESKNMSEFDVRY